MCVLRYFDPACVLILVILALRTGYRLTTQNMFGTSIFIKKIIKLSLWHALADYVLQIRVVLLCVLDTFQMLGLNNPRLVK